MQLNVNQITWLLRLSNDYNFELLEDRCNKHKFYSIKCYETVYKLIISQVNNMIKFIELGFDQDTLSDFIELKEKLINASVTQSDGNFKTFN